MYRILMWFLLLSVAGTATAFDLGNKAPLKPDSVIHENVPNPARPGGDTIFSATTIPMLPYTTSGTTCGYADDYDEACPYLNSNSPDEVYKYTPTTNESVDIDLCGSSYDTKVYVYGANLSLVACNDDYYFGPPCGLYVSFLSCVSLTAGITYYIVIDGYNGDCGPYSLAVKTCSACILTCLSTSLDEGEPQLVTNYQDAYNGGCNSPQFNSPFQHISGYPLQSGDCGAEFCGVSGWYTYQGLAYRDTDWFTLCVGPTGSVEITVDAEEPTYAAWLGPQNCSSVNVLQLMTAGSCLEAFMTIIAPPGTNIWFWVGPTVFTPPGSSPYEYRYTMRISGLCCDVAAGPNCSDFQNQTLQGWTMENAAGVISQPGPAGAGDFYLRVSDLPNASRIHAPASYWGDWRPLMNHGCATLEWDVQLYDDGWANSNPWTPSITIANGTMTGTFVAPFGITEPAGANPGWFHVVAPLGSSAGWTLSPGATWPQLLTNISDITLPVDLNVLQSEIIGYDNICLIDRICGPSVGVNKDLQNTTGQLANDIEILLQGTYTQVRHFDGYAQNHFSTFTIIPDPGGNTRLRWSNPNNDVQPGQTAHVGFNVPGVSALILGVFWTRDGVVTGCAHQCQTTTEMWGTPGSQVVYHNGCNACENSPLYVGALTVEWHATEVPLGDLNAFADRRPLRVDVISQPPILLAPGATASVNVPEAPEGAHWGVIVHKVSSSASLTGPDVTGDFLEFAIAADVLTGVPDSGPATGRPEGTADQYNLRIYNNPLRTADVEIQFDLPRPDRVTVDMYDLTGKLVRSLPAESLTAGSHSLRWDARGMDGQRLSSGVYFARVNFQQAGVHRVQRMVILK